LTAWTGPPSLHPVCGNISLTLMRGKRAIFAQASGRLGVKGVEPVGFPADAF
jgi:hypothetical protein